MAEGRINPMPSGASDPNTAQRASANMKRAQRESSLGPKTGSGSYSDPRTPCNHGPDFTMQQLSNKKVD